MAKSLKEMTLEELWQLFPIILTKHQDYWVVWYEEEKKKLTAILPSYVRIHHIGSTAIKDIWAKPIVDILVEIPKFQSLQMMKELLEDHGYLCMNETPTRLYLNRGYTQEGFEERVFHIHVRFEGDAAELRFRDYMNTHPEDARAYEALKLRLWKEYEHNRDGYTEAKTELIQACMKKAREEDEATCGRIRAQLWALQDADYAAFQAKLTPGVPTEAFIGVRVPEARKLARSLVKDGTYEAFLKNVPHIYYDENMLHGLLISEIKDYDRCIDELAHFLPYVDNWAVCDIMSPKSFKKHKAQLLDQIRVWSASEHTYICRFGMEMLMTHYLDDDFKPEYLEIPAAVRSEEYYVNMMIAWFFATALAKQWEATVPYLVEQRLDVWTHNKTIQKARESYRITAQQKAFLKELKRKA